MISGLENFCEGLPATPCSAAMQQQNVQRQSCLWAFLPYILESQHCLGQPSIRGESRGQSLYFKSPFRPTIRSRLLYNGRLPDKDLGLRGSSPNCTNKTKHTNRAQTSTLSCRSCHFRPRLHDHQLSSATVAGIILDHVLGFCGFRGFRVGHAQGLHDTIRPQRSTRPGEDVEGQLLRGGCSTPTLVIGHHLVSWNAFQLEVDQHRGQEGFGLEESELTANASACGEAPRVVGVGMSLPHCFGRETIWVEAQWISKFPTPVLRVRMQGPCHQVDPLALIHAMTAQQGIIRHVPRDGGHRAVEPQGLAEALLHELELRHVLYARLAFALQHLPHLAATRSSSEFMDRRTLSGSYSGPKK